MDKNTGCPFYYLDGPWKGRTVYGDFRNTNFDGGTYQKVTFAALFKDDEGFEYRIFCDVAYSGVAPERLPAEASGNIKVEKLNENAPDIEVKFFVDRLEVLQANGRLSEIRNA